MGILLAFAPFIAFVIVDRFVGVIPGLVTAAVIAFILLSRDLFIARKSPKLLEIGTLLLFGGLAIAALISQVSWPVIGVRLRVDIGLLLIVVVSILIRRPFTLQYARETTPRKLWGTKEFIAVNYVIASVWAAAFAVIVAADLLVLYEPQVSMRVAMITAIVVIVAAAKFTEWYPDRNEPAVVSTTRSSDES